MAINHILHSNDHIICRGIWVYISEFTAPPEMETYDFGEFTMEIPEDSNVKLAGF